VAPASSETVEGVDGGVAEIELAEYDSPKLADIADKLADENFDPPVLDDAPPVLEEAPNADLPAAAYLPFVSSVENASGAAAESASDTDSATAAEGMVQAASAPLATAHKVKYYFFNGQRIAMERDGTFTYLHGDHLGSTIAETNTTGARTAWREYKPYGTRRRGSTQLNTDRTYTGQQSDETGLMYYNARYYDPQIGHFISPDTIVPNPGNVLDYNRYMYVRGNAINMNDPSGHDPWWVQDRANSYVATPDLRYLMAAYYDGSLSNAIRPTSLQISTGNTRPRNSIFSPSQVDELTSLAQELATKPVIYQDSGEIDWNKTLQSGVGDVLSVCGRIVDGLCGISAGATGSVVAVGVRGSTDFVVDSTGDMALYATIGAGGYATFTGVSAHGKGGALIAIHGATVDDLKRWSVQFGGSAHAGPGVSAEWITGDKGGGESWHGVVLSASGMSIEGGFGAELHASGTYSWQMYRSPE